MNLSRTILSVLLGQRLPIHTGTLRLKGVRNEVRIDRDRYGIPHIRAANEADAWFAQGFCQGQDRCFQLEMMSRVARGTLAALVGKEGIDVDRISRRIGFARHARAQFQSFDDETKEQLRAFARGVNEGKTAGLPKRPHEFAILGREPTEFEPEDTIALLALMNFLLASNWDAELTRLKVLELDGPEALRAIDRHYAEWLPTTLEHERGRRHRRDLPLTPAGELFEAAHPLLSLLGAGGGSNNWAVSGGKTRFGRPIMANDPHLAPLLPAHWYLSHVKTPAWEIAGAGTMGSPGIVSGHNGFASWGVTAGMVDNTDLCIEEIGADGASCREGDAFLPCQVVEERIEVRRGETIAEKVLVTRRGPVVSPALEGAEKHALSLRATWLEVLPMNGVLDLQKTRSFADFRRCFEKWPGLTLNFVYADAEGNVGWQLAGLPPKRPPGTGIIPLPGWDPRYDWDGLAQFEDLPFVLNPKEGFVATANGKPTVAPKTDLGHDWLDGYRMARIQAEISSRDDWDVTTTQKLQMNQLSQPWKEIRETVLSALRSDASLDQEDILCLEEWDGVVGAESSGAAIFEFFLHEIVSRAVMAKAPNSAEWVMGRPYSPHLVEVPMYAFRRISWIIRLIKEKPAGWFAHGWEAEIALAFRAACEELSRKEGSEPSRWKWGHIRKLELKHPLGKVGLFRKIFNLGPFPWGGDTNTIGQATNASIDPVCNPGAIPSLRTVVDVGAWHNSRFSLPGGQSGNPLSPNYDDLLEYWKRGDGVPIAWSEEAVKESSVASLVLEPSS
jgi:penicillin G amidase